MYMALLCPWHSGEVRSPWPKPWEASKEPSLTGSVGVYHLEFMPRPARACTLTARRHRPLHPEPSQRMAHQQQMMHHRRRLARLMAGNALRAPDCTAEVSPGVPWNSQGFSENHAGAQEGRATALTGCQPSGKCEALLCSGTVTALVKSCWTPDSVVVTALIQCGTTCSGKFARVVHSTAQLHSTASSLMLSWKPLSKTAHRKSSCLPGPDRHQHQQESCWLAGWWAPALRAEPLLVALPRLPQTRRWWGWVVQWELRLT